MKVRYGEIFTHFPLFKNYEEIKRKKKEKALLNLHRALKVRTPTGAQLIGLWCYYIVPVTYPTYEVG